MIRRSYVPTLRSTGYAIEEHSALEPTRVIAADLSKHQSAAIARLITQAIDQFLVDNRLMLSTRSENKKRATLPARYRGI